MAKNLKIGDQIVIYPEKEHLYKSFKIKNGCKAQVYNSSNFPETLTAVFMGREEGKDGRWYEKYNKFLKITSGDYLKTMPKFENETINIINYKGNKDKTLLIHISPSINTLIRNVKDEVYLRQGDSTNYLLNKLK